jgi:hypothetical protein
VPFRQFSMQAASWPSAGRTPKLTTHLLPSLPQGRAAAMRQCSGVELLKNDATIFLFPRIATNLRKTLQQKSAIGIYWHLELNKIPLARRLPLARHEGETLNRTSGRALSTKPKAETVQLLTSSLPFIKTVCDASLAENFPTTQIVQIFARRCCSGPTQN